MIVIALTGLMRAGKDSVADILVREHGFVKMSFAAPLKRMMKNLNPIVGYQDWRCCDEHGPDIHPVYLQDLYDWDWTDDDIKASEYGEEVRRLWQRFGTDVMRAEQDDYWIQKACDDMMAAGHDRVVLTDCRFPNEAEMIYSLNDFRDDMGVQLHAASVWQVVRPGVEAQPGAHASEQWVGRMGEEVTIENDGTLEDLALTTKTALDFVLQQFEPEESWVPEEFVRIFGMAAGEQK